MPLIDLKTNLKSLSYGLDRPDSGNSREPLIVKDIPDEVNDATPDFILRQGAIQRGITDALRIGKLFPSHDQ